MNGCNAAGFESVCCFGLSTAYDGRESAGCPSRRREPSTNSRDPMLGDVVGVQLLWW